MTREIKFRAWDKTQNKMKRVILHVLVDAEEDLKEGDVEGATSFEWEGGVYDIMQFTGLYDKNGKEIYEGDYLTCNTKKNKIPNRGVVVYCNGFYAIETNEDMSRESDVKMVTHFWNNENFEIIGDIYTSPELLT